MTFLGDYAKVFSPFETRSEIKIAIGKQINRLLKQAGQIGPYINLENLYSYRKILSVSNKRMDDNLKALLIPVLGGFRIQVNEGFNWIYRRTVLAHEIGHTFLYDIDYDIPTMPYPKNPSNYWTREGYTYNIARALLIPENSIKNIIKRTKEAPSIRSIEKLRTLYKVSEDLLRLRIIQDLGLWDCIIFTAELTNNSTITIKPKNTSKGESFKNISLPKLLDNSSIRDEHRRIYLFLLSGFEEQYRTGLIQIEKESFHIESKITPYNKSSLRAIITKASQ